MRFRPLSIPAGTKSMQQTALNLMAIGVFLMTMTSLLGGIFHVSPFVPAGITVLIMGLTTVDTLQLKGRGVTLFLDLFTPEEERKRIIRHEAGHFLAGYLLGMPILNYSLTPWEALRQGQMGLGGVNFDLEQIELSFNNAQTMNLVVERLGTTLMAGIAAEHLLYGEDRGGLEDRRQLRQLLVKAGVPAIAHGQREQWAKVQATNLLERNRDCYDNLVQAMAARKSLTECYQIIRATALDELTAA